MPRSRQGQKDVPPWLPLTPTCELKSLRIPVRAGSLPVSHWKVPRCVRTTKPTKNSGRKITAREIVRGGKGSGQRLVGVLQKASPRNKSEPSSLRSTEKTAKGGKSL